MINSENRELEVTRDNEIAYVLSRFNEDFIYTTVREAIQDNIKHYNIIRPNLVNGYEEMFKQILIDYPYNKEEILNKREEVYINVIKIICDHYQLEYDDHDNFDLYTSASWMFHFFVANYQNYILSFFFNFIIKEKNELYTSLNLAELSKNKDLSSGVVKRNSDEQKLAAICSNISLVMRSICELDITFDQLIDTAFMGDAFPEAADHLKSIINPTVDFLKGFFLPVLEGPFGITIMSSVRLMVAQSIPKPDISTLVNKEE